MKRFSRAFLVGVAVLSGVVFAAEENPKPPSPADDAIMAAIAILESKLAETNDKLATARIQRAIRELESVLGDEDEKDLVNPPDFEVKPAILRKRFKGKAAYDAETGLLTLTYDFSKKEQLKDFEILDSKPRVADQTLWVDGGDSFKHVARFKSFSVKGLWNVRSMRGGGVGSTNGSNLGVGGNHPDTLYLGVAGGTGASKVVPDEIRSGTIAIKFSVTPFKTSLEYANERLSQPTIKKDDIHQVAFHGGLEGGTFSNFIISGIPDPQWFQEFLELK